MNETPKYVLIEVPESEPSESGHLQEGYLCFVPAVHVVTCGGDNCNIPEDKYKYFKRVQINQFTEEQIKDLSPRDAGFYKLGFEAAINSIK